MTKRTLFDIILKILGIFFLKDFVDMTPQLLSVGLYLTQADGVVEALWTLLSSLLILFVYGLVSYYLIFRTPAIIDKLKLVKDTEEEPIALTIHRSTVLSISIIVLGGLLVVNEIPVLCRQLLSYFQEKRMTYGQTHPTLGYVIGSAVKIIIGLLLMGSQRQIVNFIERKRKS